MTHTTDTVRLNPADILRGLIEDLAGFDIGDELDYRCRQAAEDGKARSIIDDQPFEVPVQLREVLALWSVVNEDGECPVTLYDAQGARTEYVRDRLNDSDSGPGQRPVRVSYELHVSARVLGINRIGAEWLVSVRFGATGTFERDGE